MLAFIKKFLFVHKLIFKGYSLLRIAQINEVKRIEINGSVLDLGSKKSVTNVTNYLNTKNKIVYGDNYSEDPDDLKIDLEKVGQLNGIKYDNILLLNVLEHIFDYKSCLQNCHSILNKNGKFFGSTPFIFRIHGSPQDYFRYTEDALKRLLDDSGFKEIEIKILEGGIFACFYSSISTITRKIPFLNNILLIICQTLDKCVYLFSKSMKKIFPLGYFFYGEK
tara:strand:- start:850 stop:1515 length:666 start_codon:yes stop_codon:yes gene_type:complete